MARPGRPERNRAAQSFRQLRRFHHAINSDEVFGTHRWSKPFISLIFYASSRSYKGLDRLANPAQASLVKPASRIISAPIGSQIITFAFSVHTWRTRKTECTRMSTFSRAFRSGPRQV